MKIKKKVVLLTFIFIISLGLLYIIVSSFFFNSLKFKPFFEHDNHTNDFKINYVKDNKDIIYLSKQDNIFTIEKIKENNKKAEYLLSFKIENIYNYDFYKKGNYYYFVYGDNIKQININNKEINDYTNNNQIIINPFNDKIYYFNNYLYDINDNQLNYQLNLVNNIKNIDFIDNDTLLISNYENQLYTLDKENNINKIANNYLDYKIVNNNLYYLYKDNNSLSINMYSKSNKNSFTTKYYDYQSIQVVDDYLYLINEKEIQKISLSRRKMHELLQISNYQNMTFDLNDIIIINDKMMYLAMIKKEDLVSSINYNYCLYRYKI